MNIFLVYNTKKDVLACRADWSDRILEDSVGGRRAVHISLLISLTATKDSTTKAANETPRFTSLKAQCIN